MTDWLTMSPIKLSWTAKKPLFKISCIQLLIEIPPRHAKKRTIPTSSKSQNLNTTKEHSLSKIICYSNVIKMYRMGWVNYTCEKSGPLFWPAFLCHSFYFRLRNSELKRERQRDFRLVRFPPFDSDYIRYNPGDKLKFSTEKVRWSFSFVKIFI